MKITHSKEQITAFGGFNFCHNLLEKRGLYGLIDNFLGKRVKTEGFPYSDIFANHLAIFLHGGDCVEDVDANLKASLQKVKKFNVCSPDTIFRGIKELATPIESHISASGIRHEFNINLPLNRLLIKILTHTKQLDKKNKDYTLDYDNQIIETNKYDAKKTYKKCKGYQSGVATIAKNIVYIEGRNGNSPAKYLQDETLGRTFSLLENEGIKIKRFRADSASFQKRVLELVSQKCDKFYIRASKCANMDYLIGQIPARKWKKTRLGCQEMELAEILYTPFQGKKSYRLVVSRIKRSDKQIDIFSKSSYMYRAVISNDYKWSNEQITSFYNQRGSSEKTFDMMNNDFGWAKLPCSFLNENTSFMIMTAIYANLYQFILAEFSEKLPWISTSFRLKKFIFRFITVPAKWIRTARKEVLKLYTSKDYSPIAFG